MSIWMKLFTISVTLAGFLTVVGTIVASYIEVHRRDNFDSYS